MFVLFRITFQTELLQILMLKISLAAISLFLNWRTFDTAIATKHTAIPLLWFHQLSTVLTFVKVLARVLWHGFSFLKPTFWASDFGFQLNFHFYFVLVIV